MSFFSGIKRWSIRGILFITLLIGGGLIYAFCVFSNGVGVYRVYRESDLPFQYRISNPTPDNYYPAIHQSAQNWNDIPLSYFEFSYSGTTGITSLGRDGTNLIFFDEEGINFQPGTNAIAFSSTFTSTTGGFHATESDLIYNARDYPPAMDGSPNQMDLEGILTHELGHHMGIAHFGEVGGPPGCGALLPTATMYGVVSPGDTTKRSLHPHDRAAAIELYPEWRVEVQVYDSLTQEPVSLANIQFTDGEYVYAEGPIGGQCPGYIVEDTLWADEAGTVSFSPSDASFQMVVEGFGYHRDTVDVTFQSPGAIPGTETQFVDVALLRESDVLVQGTVADSVNASPIEGEIEFYAHHDPSESPTAITQTDSEGVFLVNLTPDRYQMKVMPEFPYPEFKTERLFTDSVSSVTINQEPAQVLYIFDDYTSTDYTVMEAVFDSIPYTHYLWDVNVRDSLPNLSSIDRLSAPRALIWSTGESVVSILDSTKRAFLRNFLDQGGRLLLNGTNLAWKHSDKPLFQDYLHVEYMEKSDQLVLQSTSNDDPIGQGGYAGYSQGVMAPDMVRLYSPSYTDASMKFLATDYYGITRYYNNNYKAVFASFGIERMINDNPGFMQLSEVLENILDYLQDQTPTAVSHSDAATPKQFTVSPGYPNPFNARTTFQYTIPQPGEVTITIYNLRGQQVTRLKREYEVTGTYTAHWEGMDSHHNPVSSGIYLVRIQAMSQTHIQKITYLQ